MYILATLVLKYQKIPVFQVVEPLQLVGLQLRHEAETAQIDAQHRHAVQRHGAGQMQDGAVAAKGNEQISPLDLLL